MAADVQPERKVPDPSRTWLGQKAKRTQAIPKHTLQGASLEIFKDDERAEVSKINVQEFQANIDKQRRMKQERYKHTLPEYLRKEGPDDVAYEKAKDDLVKQLHEAAQARKLVDTLETSSKYFSVGLHNNSRRSKTCPDKSSWYRRQDLKYSEDINVLGLSDPANYTKNYNRDKYRRKVPTHQYSVIGDPLKTGMDFTDKAASPTKTTLVQRAKNPDWLPADAYKKESETDMSCSIGIDLPLNIQHKFGTKICRDVLNDQKQVDEILERQQKVKSLRSRRPRTEEFKLPENSIDPLYEGLSALTRTDVFPGYAANHKKSFQKTVHTEDVFKNRMKDPEQFRYQRDALSTWAEHNIIRDRMKKAWAAMEHEKKGD